MSAKFLRCVPDTQHQHLHTRHPRSASACLTPNISIASSQHRYIKQLFLVLGTRLAQFERYCSVVKCVLDGPLDTHIWPFSRTLGEEILHLYWIYCFWVPFSGRISHHFPTKPSFSPIFRIARLFENFLYQSISILTWPGAFSGPILLIRTKPDMI